MNLRDLKSFITYQIDNKLAECGIDVDQIEQIKIYDSQIPSNDNDDNLVWKLKTDNLSYLDVLSKIEQWINNEIVICYMNDTLNRDLSIEIMGNGKGMMAI
jgi:hypothetical protein